MSGAEKFISEHTKTCSNVIIDYQVVYNGVPQAIYKEWLTPDQARKAVEIAREEMIEKACKWLQGHYRVIDGEIEDYIWSLKQAMKDE